MQLISNVILFKYIWTLTTSKLNRIEAAEMDFLRHLASKHILRSYAKSRLRKTVKNTSYHWNYRNIPEQLVCKHLEKGRDYSIYQ